MLSDTDIAIINSIINTNLDSKMHIAFIFGSRATDKSQKFSDVDIGIAGPPLDTFTISHLLDEFERSSLSYIVEIVEFRDLTESFIAVALEKIMPINFSGGVNEVKRALHAFKKGS